MERNLAEEGRMRQALATSQKQLADAANKAKQEQEVALRQIWCGDTLD